jgi:hypothetical protein
MIQNGAVDLPSSGSVRWSTAVTNDKPGNDWSMCPYVHNATNTDHPTWLEKQTHLIRRIFLAFVRLLYNFQTVINAVVALRQSALRNNVDMVTNVVAQGLGGNTAAGLD